MPSITVDCHEVFELCDELAKVIGVENMQKAIKTTLYHTGKRAPVQIRYALQKVYDARPAFIRSGFRTPKVSASECIIPLSSNKGNHFKAKTSYGRFGTNRKPKVKILKGRLSALPSKMDNQGGNPPFFAFGGTYTRKSKKRYPIARIAGVSVAQMPMENSKGNEPTEKVIEEICYAELGRAIRAVSRGYLQGW